MQALGETPGVIDCELFVSVRVRFVMSVCAGAIILNWESTEKFGPHIWTKGAIPDEK